MFFYSLVRCLRSQRSPGKASECWREPHAEREVMKNIDKHKRPIIRLPISGILLYKISEKDLQHCCCYSQPYSLVFPITPAPYASR